MIAHKIPETFYPRNFLSSKISSPTVYIMYLYWYIIAKNLQLQLEIIHKNILVTHNCLTASSSSALL